MTTRADRIAAAQAKMDKLKAGYHAFLDAESEFKMAQASYDLGERVRVTETCRRGCCVELEYDGVITDRNSSYYTVKSDKGVTYPHVYIGNMKRLTR